MVQYICPYIKGRISGKQIQNTYVVGITIQHMTSQQPDGRYDPMASID